MLTLSLTPAERMTLERLSPEAKQDFDYWHRLLAPLLRQRPCRPRLRVRCIR